MLAKRVARVSAKQSQAPHLTRASSVFRLTARASTRWQRSARLRNLPPSWRALRMACTASSPTPLMAARPNRMAGFVGRTPSPAAWPGVPAGRFTGAGPLTVDSPGTDAPGTSRQEACPRLAGANSAWPSFTSGGNTSTPMVRASLRTTDSLSVTPISLVMSALRNSTG